MEPDRPPAGRPSPARGVVLIAVAVVLGLFLLRAMDEGAGTSAAEDDALEAVDDGAAADDGSEDDGAAEPATDEAPGDGGGDGGDEAPPPPPEPRPPGEITVIVLNGSDVQGAAGEQTELLAAAGYQTAVAANAPAPVAQTQVQHAEGYEIEAAVLAEQIGLAPDAIAPISPDLGAVDLQGSQLVVLLGTDRAGG